ncbi:MAG: hypothetical protein ACI82Q_001346 [Nonlabens sp.]|jgi:hypothetical protein
MNYYIFGIGVVILLIMISDLINTALSVKGAGFLSKKLAKGIWWALLLLSRKTGTRKILELGGVIILVSVVVNWLVMIWFSASLLFISDPGSLMNVETNTEPTIVGKVFYTGYTLSALGLGDMEPTGPFWDILTAILSFAGLILISIAITYLIPVVNGEIEKRRLSVYITTLGCSVDEILTNYWNGKDFKELEQPFFSLTSMIILHAQNHKAYSVLHYFHTSDKKEAFALNLTNLDETLSILLHQIPSIHRPSYNTLMSLRKAISSYLITLPAVFIVPAEDSPPEHDLAELVKIGIPIISNQDVNNEFTKLLNRRKILLSLIRDDGWEWSDLQAGSYNHELKLGKDGHSI